jgi:hypothetical protein
MAVIEGSDRNLVVETNASHKLLGLITCPVYTQPHSLASRYQRNRDPRGLESSSRQGARSGAQKCFKDRTRGSSQSDPTEQGANALPMLAKDDEFVWEKVAVFRASQLVL